MSTKRTWRADAAVDDGVFIQFSFAHRLPRTLADPNRVEGPSRSGTYGIVERTMRTLSRLRRCCLALSILAACFSLPVAVVGFQSQPPQPQTPKTTLRIEVPPPSEPSPVERLGPDRFRIGSINIDTAKKEVSVPGVVNEVTTLEFLANTKGGFKAYESAIELDAHAINMNVALMLIGLDPTRSVLSKSHLDPVPPKGDPVEVWVEWNDGKPHRIRGESIVYNEVTKQTLSEGPWVYTGSRFSKDRNAYLADLDGVMIGFVHSPSPLIESPRPLNPGEYGATRFNPNLGLKPGTAVTLIVKSLPRE
jgi:hypothetical protein